MRFRLVPKSSTWITLNGRYALDCRKDASFGAQYKNFNEVDPNVSGKMSDEPE